MKTSAKNSNLTVKKPCFSLSFGRILFFVFLSEEFFVSVKKSENFLRQFLPKDVESSVWYIRYTTGENEKQTTLNEIRRSVHREKRKIRAEKNENVFLSNFSSSRKNFQATRRRIRSENFRLPKKVFAQSFGQWIRQQWRSNRSRRSSSVHRTFSRWTKEKIRSKS